MPILVTGYALKSQTPHYANHKLVGKKSKVVVNGQGDHAQWMVTGLEAKSDGSVYVLGNSTFYGAPALRQYDAAGGYRRTVFPPPSGKPVEDVQGWGVNVRADG
ncbi:MAG: hypothetical protein NTX14_02940, partial [Candidatus Nealsonbacteria bacterium]|nr:hypothetical protein [Candidatus Nealsonbacteria bacterium]